MIKKDKEKKEKGVEETKDYTALIEQVQSEYKVALDFMQPKFDERALRLKLYNNQKKE